MARSSGWAADADRSLGRTIVRTGRAFVIALGVLGCVAIYTHAVPGAQRLGPRLGEGARFALLAVLATVVLELFAVLLGMLPLRRRASGFGRATAFTVAIVERIAMGCAIVAALVGWLSVIPGWTSHAGLGDVLWVLVAGGIALLSAAIVEMIPDEVVDGLQREAWTRRAAWLDAAVQHWQVDGRRRIMLGQAACYLVLSIGGATVLSAVAGRSIWMAAALAGLVVLWLTALGGLLVAYVLREWIVACVFAMAVLLTSTYLICVAILDTMTAARPVLMGLLWVAALVSAFTVVVRDVGGTTTAAWSPQAFRGGVVVALNRRRRRTARLLEPACRCTRSIAFGRVREFHARRTGRAEPRARCDVPQHARAYGTEADRRP